MRLVLDGRTLWERLTGQNEPDTTPMELKYHNPLKTEVGRTVCLKNDPDLSDVNFQIEKISVYETKLGYKKFCHTDYHLRGVSLESDGYIRLRLRFIEDDSVVNSIGHRVQLLYLYDEFQYDEGFHKEVLGHESGEFLVHHDDDGNELEVLRQYWRIDDVMAPYSCKMTILQDVNEDGDVEEDEIECHDVTYWDYSRLTEDEYHHEFTEFLTIEMDNETGYFIFFRGTEIISSQIEVI